MVVRDIAEQDRVLQHLWAEFSETVADALDQFIKYGGGAPEIQENLRLKSEMVALIESGQQRARLGLDKQQTIAHPENPSARVFRARR